MTSQKRFKRMYEHRPADRIPVTDKPWNATVERWRREGMPKDVSYAEFFGFDVTHSWIVGTERLLMALVENPEAMEAEMRKVVPVVKESGGYVFSSDHSVPSNVSLESFRHVVELAKKLGRYD